jgi:pyrimidine-nucleoside phosphorylase
LCFKAIHTGEALERFRKVIEAQGGDSKVVDDLTRLPVPPVLRTVNSPIKGVVKTVQARPIGHATMLLGAGRKRAGEPVDHAVGVLLHKKIGDRVGEGEALCTILARSEGKELQQAEAIINGAFEVGKKAVKVPDLIVERL